ncbi:PspA/IM30 family protein [Paenibacillus macerans]|uniref:PspA/IM30 family protein n=1 Tax=Paenibacillus macerans TaxID=44252 RepID=UPI00203D9F74|nr:PspA/IM30 family protein [Paenibacillus macerans]MCM3703309.1 PspA/IM30 family protein [Paenibacillus macerans]
MGILARFRDVMRANIGSLLERAEDPEKTIDEYMRQMNRDLGQVKAETASVQAEESRAKRALDECGAEVRKLQRYAEKAVESGDEERARKFLEQKAQQAERLGELQPAYDEAAANAAQMKQMQDKLVADLSELEARRTTLKAKLAQAGRLQQIHAGASAGGVEAAFRAAEEQADRALNEAEALAELRDGARKDDLDELIAQLEKGKDDNAGD